MARDKERRIKRALLRKQKRGGTLGKANRFNQKVKKSRKGVIEAPGPADYEKPSIDFNL